MKLFIFLVVGILLGPSFFSIPWPTQAAGTVSWFTNLFLFTAGLELSFKALRPQLGKALRLSFGAFVLPFLMGLVTAAILVKDSAFLSGSFNAHIFLAIALSISALPVAIQILKDLNLYHTDIGRLIIATATLCDIIAWISFAFLLSSEGFIPWLQSHISVVFFFLGLFASNFNWSPKLHDLLTKCSRWVFGPVFFISIGWKLNFWQHFDGMQVLIVFTLATLSKFIGSYWSARTLGFDHKRSSLIGLTLNSRGAVEIVIASLALKQGLIDETIFTTLIIMAVATSLLPEPLTHLLKLREE